MNLRLFKQLWGHQGTHEDAITDVLDADFHGIEGAPPAAPGDRAHLARLIADADLHYIAEISTGIFTPDKWVPDPHSTVEQHLETFRVILDQCLEMTPLKITSMSGNDLWPIADSIRFYRESQTIAADRGVEVSVETHRGRSTFHPLSLAAILQALPDLPLTCDFSHWCVVTERSAIVDEFPDLLDHCARNCRHVHARVGYDQGAQVPDPRAPEYAANLAHHERWWDTIWSAQRAAGMQTSTLTPESGPDGYLQLEPFTQKPVADLWEINRWIAHRQRDRFSTRA